MTEGKNKQASQGKGVNGNLIPPKKGEIRNPKGKPKGIPHSSTRLRRLLELTNKMENPITGELEGFSVAEQMDLKQIIRAIKGDTKAYTTIMDRLEGKPKETIDQNTKVQVVTPLVDIEQLKKED